MRLPRLEAIFLPAVFRITCAGLAPGHEECRPRLAFEQGSSDCPRDRSKTAVTSRIASSCALTALTRSSKSSSAMASKTAKTAPTKTTVCWSRFIAPTGQMPTIRARRATESKIARTAATRKTARDSPAEPMNEEPRSATSRARLFVFDAERQCFSAEVSTVNVRWNATTIRPCPAASPCSGAEPPLAMTLLHFATGSALVQTSWCLLRSTACR